MTRYEEMTPTQRREVRMYGCTVDQMREAVEERLAMFRSPSMMVISMLSDAQEMTNLDFEGRYDMMLIEDQRQLLNRAKWILSTYCDIKG